MDQSEPQVELTDDGFETEVHRSALPVLVEFWAEWSGGSHIMAPILGSLAKSLAGRIKVMRMNIEQSPRTAKQFGVHTVPMMLLFRSGGLVDLISGMIPRTELEKRLERRLSEMENANHLEPSTSP